MSYPSMNAKSRALPPATMPPRRRTFNLHSLVRRNSHELPLMKPSNALDIPSDISPGRPFRELSINVDETNQSGYKFSQSQSHGHFSATPPLLHTRSASSIPQSRSGSLPTFPIAEDEKVDNGNVRISTRSSSNRGIPIYFKEQEGEYEMFDAPSTPPATSANLEEEDPMNLYGSCLVSPRTRLFPQSMIRTQPQATHSIRDDPFISVSYNSTPFASSIPASPSPISCARMSPASHSVASFNAILLSQKTTQLPLQPAGFPSSQQKNLTLVQLQVAASTFVIPMDLIARYPSHLERFVSGCIDDDWRTADSDGSISEAETEFDDDDQISLESSFSYLSIKPPFPSPPLNIRATSVSKLQKLGVLPSLNRRSGFFVGDGEIDGPTTPRAATTNFGRAPPPRPPRPETPPMSPSRQYMRRLEILLCRSPEPYIAIDYFFSTGLLLPSLKSMLEGESTLKGCPLCEDSLRARRLQEVETEAAWLGLESLAQVCRAERRRNRADEARPTKKAGDGWI